MKNDAAVEGDTYDTSPRKTKTKLHLDDTQTYYSFVMEVIAGQNLQIKIRVCTVLSVPMKP